MTKANANWSETWRRFFKVLNRKGMRIAAVTVGATEVLLTADPAGENKTTLKDRGLLEIYNNSAAIIYVGPTGVAVTTGIPILPTDYYHWYSEDDLFAIAAGAGNDVRVMETK